MDDLKEKYTMCLVVVFPRGKIWVFGAYDSEELAKKRVDELDYLIPLDCTVQFYNHIVWTEAEQ